MTTPPPDKTKLEEAFILSAMISLAGGTAYAATHPGLLSGSFYREPLFGLVHLFTTGWITLMILGVLCRLSPMTLKVTPRTGVVGWLVYGLWSVGAFGLIFHMARGEWFGVWTAALASLGAVILLPVLHPGILRRAREGDWIARYALAGMGHLLLAASLGILIGLNKHLLLVSVNPIQVLGAHLHLAAVGWATYVILGFGRQLLPTLASGRDQHPRADALRFWLLELSLLGLVVGFLGAPGLVRSAAPLAALAIGLHVWRPLKRFIAGRVTDRASQWASVALLTLGLTALLGVAIAWDLPQRTGLPVDRAQFAYGFLLLFGWITPAITAFAMKLFPLWVWQERFAADLGKKPVPVMDALFSTRLQTVTGCGLTLGTVLVTTGILGAWSQVLFAGVWTYAAGILAFLINFVRMARWGLLKISYRPSADDLERFASVYGNARVPGQPESDCPGM